MSKQQYFIQDPQSKKKIVVGRDAYNLLQREQKKSTETQERFQNKMKEINNVLTKKFFEGKKENIELALKFKEDGSINLDEAPQLSLKGDLGNLDPDTEAKVKQALYEFMQCMSEALTERAKQTEEKIKNVA